jgi:hypothetical protein
MKKFLIPMMMFWMLSASAHIEFEGDGPAPTNQEIAKSRACFEELSKNGCGDPGEDLNHFRSCLHNVFPSLTKDCQKMMSHLYSARK